VLSFDDATLDHFEVVKPVLERLSCRGLFFVPTAKLDRSGRLNSDQVRELGTSGHTIGSHSHEHARLDRLPEEDIRVQLELSQQKITQLRGTPPLFFAPPGGFYNPLIRNVASETGFSVVRTMKWGYNRHLDLAALECVPINRFLTDADFCRLLSGRNMQLAYQAKQVTKRLVPARLYGQLRSVVFGLTGRN
jgi:peptidoglycan/xylan/chitin deacetylase (PgdA/CDA1 family)